MRRAVLALILVAALPVIAWADTDRGVVDAIGMLNYRHHGRLRVGDWVRYRVHGNSERGLATDYTVTLVIAGEERWWGEDCFWVETQLSYFGQEPMYAASLLSYAVFNDSLPAVRFPRYIRKYIDALDSQGKAAQQVYRRAPYELTQRGWSEYQGPVKRDTLGMEKVTVPKGTFEALHEDRHYRTFVTEHRPDSSVYFEKTKDHSYWTSDAIPITGLVRVDQVDTQRSRVWKAGEFETSPLNVLEQAKGSTELIDFGTGMKANLVPEFLQHALPDKREAEKRPAGARKPATTGARKTATRG